MIKFNIVKENPSRVDNQFASSLTVKVKSMEKVDGSENIIIESLTNPNVNNTIAVISPTADINIDAARKLMVLDILIMIHFIF